MMVVEMVVMVMVMVMVTVVIGNDGGMMVVMVVVEMLSLFTKSRVYRLRVLAV